MSGIFGLWRLDGRPVDPAEIHAMSARLAHRGPDDAGIWREGPVALGHRMLHTTPESLIEKQPLVFEDAGLVLTADARVDNRDDLIGALRLRDRPPGEITDAELILRAYETWGRACPERIIGDFAFAIWDGRRRELFCARDPMGVKPFYYHHAPGRLFAWGSEAKGILAVGEVPDRLDELQIAYHIERIAHDREITFWRQIRRLPAGETAVIDPDGRRRATYWELDPHFELRLGSDQEYAAAFREVFTHAVRSQVRSTHRVASTLSGGLDSSSIACVAERELETDSRGPLHTVSAVFPGLPAKERALADESSWIDRVARREGIRSHLVRLDNVGPLDDLDTLLGVNGEAHILANLHLHWRLFRAAAERGVRVFLDGTDGDTTVGLGYTLIHDLARAAQWDRFGGELAALTRRLDLHPRTSIRQFALAPLVHFARSGRWGAWHKAVASLSENLGVSRGYLLLRYGVGGLLPAFALQLAREARGVPKVGTRWIEDDFARRVGLASQKRRLGLDKAPGFRHTSGRAVQISGLRNPVFQYIFEVHDRAAAALHLEPRYPFCDRRLIEFCVSLPMEQRLRDGWTRYVLRTGLDGVLPPEIQWRPRKQNLSPGTIRGLRQENRGVIAEVIAERSSLAPYARIDTLETVYERFCEGGTSHAVAADDAMILYQATTLGRWLSSDGVARAA